MYVRTTHAQTHKMEKRHLDEKELWFLFVFNMESSVAGYSTPAKCTQTWDHDVTFVIDVRHNRTKSQQQ